MIDTSSLSRALATLDEALDARTNAPEDKLIRDACIQRFEYTYELAYRTLRRYLEETEQNGVSDLSFPKLVRLGYDRGLLFESWDVWSKFRDARNITSHTYNEEKALLVTDKIPFFADSVRFLVAQIERQQQ